MVHWSAVVVRRTFTLSLEDKRWHYALAPFFSHGLYRSTCQRKGKAWFLAILPIVIGFPVAAMRYPYRQITDFGVVINLIGGTVAMATYTIRAVSIGKLPQRSPDFPVSDIHYCPSEPAACAESLTQTPAGTWPVIHS